MPAHARQHPVDLPVLDPEVTLVDVDTELGVTPIQTLLLDRLFGGGGDAHWVDGANRARTARLRELAPHQRYLERIHVARGFTAHQHTALIDRLAGRLTDRPAVVVATGLDRLYRSADVSTDRAKTLQVRALAALARVARVHETPVILTRVREDDFTAPLANAAATHLRCTATPFGPRFEDTTGETKTLVYHTEEGWVQTTLAYWQEVLAHRVRRRESATGDSTSPPMEAQ